MIDWRRLDRVVLSSFSNCGGRQGFIRLDLLFEWTGGAMRSFCPTLTIVVPCYNEEDVLPETSARLDLLLAELVESGRIAADSSVCLVDDGSKDDTWAIIENLRGRSSRFGGLKLSRNCGHQNALMTGLLGARGVC